MKLSERFRDLDFNTKVIVSVISVFSVIAFIGLTSNFISSLQTNTNPEPTQVPTQTATPKPVDTVAPDVEPVPVPDSEGYFTYDISLSNKDLTDVMKLSGAVSSELCSFKAGETDADVKARYDKYLSEEFKTSFSYPRYKDSYLYRTCITNGSQPEGFNDKTKTIKISNVVFSTSVSADQASLSEEARAVKRTYTSYIYYFQKINGDWKIVKVG